MRRALGILVGAVLVVASCGDEGSETTSATSVSTSTSVAETTTTLSPTTTSSASSTSATSASTTIPATTTPPDTTIPATTTTIDDTVRIDVTVTSGEVSGGGRISVDLGSDVVIVVESDVADEVHVHGYDLFGDTVPGIPAVIEFVANIPGIFEVELEGSHIEIVELEVS